jgi:hypothetical protein
VNPLVGFTIRGQLWIVVHYYERGTLTAFLSSTPDSVLTPLFLSRLVWAIATAMSDVHGHKIIHRDLKAANIWIDDELMPRLTDFWNSRPFIAHTPMTARIGTINIMAPEVMEGHVYDEAADVFSFGVLVYFICERTQPFGSFSDGQIEEAYTKTGERPEFTDRTPKAIRQVIARCWQKDPAARPSFFVIAASIARGRVRFPGASKHALIADIRALSESEQAPLSRGGSADAELALLDNPDGPQFEEALENCADTLSPIRFESFFAVVVHHFDHPNYPLIRRLMDAMRRMTLRGPEFIDAVCRSEFYELPVLRDGALLDQIMPFIAQLVFKRPSQIRPFMKPIMKALVLSNTHPMVKLLWQFVGNFNEIERPLPVIDIYLESGLDILKDADATIDFLRILYHLIVKIRPFKEARFPVVCKLLCQYLTSASGDVLIQTWRTLVHVHDGEFALPAETVAAQIHQPQLVNLIISVYLRMPRFAPHRGVIEAWLSEASDCPRILNILLRLAAQQFEVGAIFLSNTRWISRGIGGPFDTLRLVFVLFRYPQLRQAIGTSADLPVLLVQVAALRTELAVVCVSRVFRLVPFVPLLLALDKVGFVEAFVALGFELDTRQSIDAIFFFIDAAGRIGFSLAYIDLCPRLWEIIANGQEGVASALQLMALMSKHPPCVPVLRNQIIIEYFKKVADLEAYRSLAHMFLRNVEGDSL